MATIQLSIPADCGAGCGHIRSNMLIQVLSHPPAANTAGSMATKITMDLLAEMRI